MAKHNDVFLYGQVLTNPKIIRNNETQEYIRGVCPILVIRGVRNYGSKEIKHIGFDKPTIISGNPAQIMRMEQWHKGDMVEIKGAITTKDVNKVSICKHCGTKNAKQGVIIFVNPIYTKLVESAYNENGELKERLDASGHKVKASLTLEEGTALLKESCEISNQVHLVGMLCREPASFHHDGKNLDITNYQLAVSRKFRILEDAEDNRVDFPWVKSYGGIARDDYKYLKKGAYILVDGMIQSRDIKRTQVCSHCGQEYEFNETAIDIVPYSTEYLRNFRTEEEIASNEAAERQAAIQSIFKESDIERPIDVPEIPPDMYDKKNQNS